MEPILQFDPANLSIWYNPVLHRDTSLDQMASSALLGDHTLAFDRARAIEDPLPRVRAAHMLSAICHEQRHFVDMVLTNFGQSMIRQFTSLLVNAPAALIAAQASARIGLPITVYDDAVKRRLIGVDANEDLTRIARDVRSRARQMAPDALEHDVPTGGRISVGGRAQLEALGFFTQLAVLQSEFDPDMARAVQEDTPDRLHLRNQYAWAAILGADLGLIPPGEVPEGDLAVLLPAVSALLYGTLMIRRWAQEQSYVEDGNSGFAAARIDPLVARLRSTRTLERATSTKEAWQAVDFACGEVFGCSAREELDHDLNQEARFCDRAAGVLGGEESAVVRFLRGQHAARLRLVELFDNSPEVVVDPNRYGELLAAIDPVPIFVDASGSEEIAEGWTTLWEGTGQLGSLGQMTWSWASTPLNAIATRDRINVVSDIESWIAVVRDLIPLVKLLLRARRQPRVLGAELEQAEALLIEMGIEARFDPLYAAPVADTRSDTFWYLTGRPSAVCDGCSSPLSRGSGHYVPAVALRQNDQTATWLVQKLGGGELGLFQARKDWSGWLLCDTCHAEVAKLAAPRGA